ncbi:transcriptional regulator NrdR [Thermoflavimicrobium dichotomicum]|uniref:Transcriptional repressor NrdR n=1 Tax=Thermoflavimicrobium dichotomicum TaxID=46223 RepID=A0A1I3L9M3_9BACL|nr:transcriptional regulator NrdR [Thermoflavimicrobium dichotomicum]SFI81401.1 transcriptional repressor NrdR [Thermoflavimicrobium dichotomicum]
MRCPYCGNNGSRVLDSRPIHEGKAIRRRRECESCAQRFTTFEMIEEKPVIVIKKDGSREEFNREKLLRGLLRACEKRPVPIEHLEALVMDIERTLRERDQLEISTNHIGEMVLDRLINVDEVAYVRFASVYRQFKDINVFVKELEDLLNRSRRRHKTEKRIDSQV